MLGLSKKMAGSPLPTWGEVDTVAAELMVPVVGAVAGEVSVMGGLTANLHVLMASFYRPQGSRTKIMIERDTFSSDYVGSDNPHRVPHPFGMLLIVDLSPSALQYAVQSQIQLHGLDIDSNVVTIEPDPSSSSSDTPYLLSTSRILATIDEHGPTTALLLLSGVQYVSGQVLAMQEITAYAQTHGILVGWDLAHAVGNVELRLHDWGVDFAVWCNYKFMNAGPGAIGGVFVHERHGRVDRDRGVDGYRPRLAGWWGNEMGSRFKMESSAWPTHPPMFVTGSSVAAYPTCSQHLFRALARPGTNCPTRLSWIPWH
jgi:kynureninase